MNICVQFSNPFVLIFIIGSFLSFFINQFLEFIDYKARIKSKGQLPEILQNIPLAVSSFDNEKLKNICAYENAKYFSYIPSSICSLIFSLALVIFGFYPFIFDLLCIWFGFPATFGNNFLIILLFLIFTSIPEAIISLPFELYREFVVEKKFGFSSMTFKLWLSDQLKSLVLGGILLSLISLAGSFFLLKFPENWWFILAVLLISFTFIMQIIYPKFIAPLFNKFTPLPEGELKDKITEILNKTGFSNGGLFVMDASKRSGHSNAYFSGFGKTKRIVLYDTLIKSMTADELTAVLGHELGHFKLKHIIKRLCIMIPLEFVVLFILNKLSHFTRLYTGFGFSSVTPENVNAVQFIGLFLSVSIFNGISELISPITNLGSRKDEYQADAYSAEICETSEHLITGLIKLNSENLSELFPPEIYVFWNYSHPTLVERISALNKIKNKGDEK